MMMIPLKLFTIITLLLVSISFLVQHSDCSLYYVTSMKPGRDCPTGYPCQTLNFYAAKNKFAKNETDLEHVTLIFLNGVHNLTHDLNVRYLQKFEMVPQYNTSEEMRVIVQFLNKNINQLTLIAIKDVNKVVIESLEIHGSGQVLLFSGRKATVHNVMFQDNIILHIQVSSGVQNSTVGIKSTLFDRSTLSVVGYGRRANSTLIIKDVHFLHGTGVGGLLVICGVGFSSIAIKGITIGESENASLSFRQYHIHCVPICDERELDSDIYISPYVDFGNVSIKISNAILSHRHGTGIQFSILPFELQDLRAFIDITNCSISAYPSGAIVWDSSQFSAGLQNDACLCVIPNVVYLTIKDCEITNNFHYLWSDHVVQAAGLSVTFSQQGSVVLKNSIFRANRDLSSAENVVWINKVETFNISDCKFVNNTGRAIYAYESNIFASGSIPFINNTVHYGSGGALYLESSSIMLSQNTAMDFYCNSALRGRGGAIFVNSPLFDDAGDYMPCFYEIEGNHSSFTFINNSATDGGDSLYGVSVRSCNYDPSNTSTTLKKVFSFYPPLNSSISAISSDPTRVCICICDSKSHVHPQCSVLSKIFTNITVSPGENFSISAVLVGADFGTSRGTVYAYLLESDESIILEESYQAQSITNVSNCTKLQYRIKSNVTNTTVTLYMRASYEKIRIYGQEKSLNNSINDYNHTGVPPFDLQTTPIYINVTLTSCPVGFKLQGDPPTCECYTEVKDLSVSCDTVNGVGFIARAGTMWIGGDGTGVIYNQNCPPDYCIATTVNVDLVNQPDSQCAFNRARRLCGGCKENYSLAIGSSHCIHCPNNNNLALLIFFAAAGFLLVLFVGILNLTVTNGMFNGIIFYANIVWTNKILLFPEDSKNYGMYFLKIFIAWLNLDFGIETCFIRGLNAYWKTWLQFVFPFYIWMIVLAIIVCCRYSPRMTELVGNRAVHILATLISLSYVKLIRAVIDGLGIAILNVYPESSNVYVWSLDGNFYYGHYPHLILLIAVILACLLLWSPYTFVMTFTQCFRHLDWKICCWTIKLKPFFDSHFAFLKDRHHYWFGLLLFVRGILSVTFALTSANAPTINLFLLFLSSMLLLIYEISTQLYRKKSVQAFNGLCLLNLAILGCSVIYSNLIKGNKSVAIILSVSVVLAQFCGLIIYNVVALFQPYLPNFCPRVPVDNHPEPIANDQSGENDKFRDSILTANVTNDNN